MWIIRMQTPTRRTHLGISTGSLPNDPWVNQDPWQQYHNSSAQAAGIPDRPFPYSMANSPDQPQPFASQSSNQGFSQVIPPPPGFQNVNPQMIPIPVNTPHRDQLKRLVDRMMKTRSRDQKGGCHLCQLHPSKIGNPGLLKLWGSSNGSPR